MEHASVYLSIPMLIKVVLILLPLDLNAVCTKMLWMVSCGVARHVALVYISSVFLHTFLYLLSNIFFFILYLTLICVQLRCLEIIVHIFDMLQSKNHGLVQWIYSETDTLYVIYVSRVLH